MTKAAHAVVLNNGDDSFPVLFKGGKGQCETFINRMVAQCKPTHNLYIIRDTERGLNRLKKGLKGGQLEFRDH